MSTLEIPAERTYSDIELDMIENEPPNLFPMDQDSVWGQMRKLFADPLQVLADQLSQWFTNLDPRTADDTDLPNWETQLGLPTNPNLSIAQRRAFVLARFQTGPFTRTRRRLLVESFITATFGDPISFGSDGMAFTSGGTSFADEPTADLTTLYQIIENIPAFSYEVKVLNTVDIDQDGLARELTRITPAGLSFTISRPSSL